MSVIWSSGVSGVSKVLKSMEKRLGLSELSVIYISWVPAVEGGSTVIHTAVISAYLSNFAC